MNLSTYTDMPLLTAKMCSSITNRRVAYAFSDNSDFLFLDKRDIILNQIDACEKLLRYATDENDRIAIGREIEELKSALDLMQESR